MAGKASYISMVYQCNYYNQFNATTALQPIATIYICSLQKVTCKAILSVANFCHIKCEYLLGSHV